MSYDDQNPNDKGYRGSTNLKRVGTNIPWTKELLEEFIKCSEDPVYFGEQYMKVVHIDRGLETMKMYDYQRDIVQSVHDKNRVVAECARQSGKTTALTVSILHYIIFNEHKNVAILANKAEVSREILSRIKIGRAHV